MNLKNISVALAGVVAALVSGPVVAAPNADEVRVPVSFDGLNLQSEGGARTALRRIERAAGAICGEAPALVELGRTALHRVCMTTTVDRAVKRLAAPMVTAAYEGSAYARPIISAAR